MQLSPLYWNNLLSLEIREVAVSCSCLRRPTRHALTMGILQPDIPVRRMMSERRTKLTDALVRFFFLEYGRCRTVARSLHEHKQLKTTFVQGPRRSRSAGKSQQTKNQKPNKTTRRPANPPARFAFRQSKKQQTRHTKGAGAQTKTPTNKICQRTQWFDHCITLKNMRK